MIRRFAFATAVVFAVAIMIIIPFDGPFTLLSTAIAQQPRINSNTSSSQRFRFSHYIDITYLEDKGIFRDPHRKDL
jgi:hypothetical protein